MLPTQANDPGGLAPAVPEEDVAAERPWLYGFLIAPSAVVANGVVQGGALAYLLSQQHVDIGRTAQIISILALPTSLYFLWSPITDFFIRRRNWLLVGGISAAILMLIAFRQHDLASRTALVLMFLSGCCTQLVVSSCGGMMGAMRSERAKRIAGSFYQAGSMGFGAAAVSVLLHTSKVRPSSLGLVAAILTGVPALFALAAPKQAEISGTDFGETMQLLWQECKGTFLRWSAIPYVLCMTFPMASGSAASLLPGVASAYHVSGSQVGWMNGVGGALLMSAGSLTTSLIPAKVRAVVVYMVLALINALTLFVLWLGPLTPLCYFVGVTLYLFTVGACYAFFTAVVLEFMGSSGKSGSGRYSVINSLGNVPVLYMIALDGMGASKWGPRALAGTEGVLSIAGASILLTLFLLFPPKKSVEVMA